MAGGIDWFRWHHGSVSDPKFQLVAKKAGASVAEVIAVWACLLEAASQSAFRGHPGEPDFEALDCALGLEDGKSQAIHDRMKERGLLAGDGRVTAWERRQPKREDDTAADRKRRQRERDEQYDPQCPAPSRDVTQSHDRGEESREEINTPLPPKGVWPGFDAFWGAWPRSDRKQAKGKCLDAWKKAGAEPHAALIVAHVDRLKASSLWTKDNGQFVPAPLVYVNQRRWEGAESSPATDDPYGLRNAL